MKQPLTLLKTFVAALALGWGASAQAQSLISPVTPDATAAPGPSITSVRNTGTDATVYNGKPIQAMTWDDNGNILLSWDYAGTTGSLTIRGRGALSDPDVVLAQEGGSGKLYLNVVYIEAVGPTQSQTKYAAYYFNGSTFVLAVGPVALGASAANLEHFNPNIDANKSGYTAIVWQQRITDSVTRIDVTPSTPLIPAYTYYQAVTFDRSFLATGTITGTFAGCSNGTAGRLVGDLSGVPYQLLEQRLNPDVAIADNGPNPTFPVVSVTYMRHYVDGTGQFRIVNNLVVDQTYYGCDRIEHKEWAVDGEIGRPRIAAYGGADPQYYFDVEVAYDWRSSPCAVGVGPVDYYAIQNYGKSSGAFRPDFTAVSFVIDPVLQRYASKEAIQPAVSYYGAGNHQYVITWAGAYDDGRDVWASSLEDGLPLQSVPGQPTVAQAYSRVNLYPKGNQDIPSVAGRHLPDKFDAVHLFRNEYLSLMGYKYTNAPAGSAQLRSAQVQANPSPAAPASTRMQAFPNPSHQSLELSIPLRDGERVQQLTVHDALGRRVETLPVTSETNLQHVVWQPKQTLPTGNYMVKLVTNQRSETLLINRD